MDFFPYEDIVDLPHHISRTHPPMPRLKRAAQFAPFAALSGHEEAIEETARLPDCETELSETDAAVLDRQYRYLVAHIREQPEVTFTYFVPDGRKTGGAYVTRSGRVVKADEYERTITLLGGEKISQPLITKMEGELFREVDMTPFSEEEDIPGH